MLADFLLFRALRDRLGFSRLRSAATGGAALGPDTFRFFKALGVPLRQLYGLWMSGKSIAADVGRQAIGKGYPVFSWYCIMSGMGIFPDPKDLRPAAPPDNRYNMEEIDNLLQRSALNFGSQREVLTNIPRKIEERSLQIYFW